MSNDVNDQGLYPVYFVLLDTIENPVKVARGDLGLTIVTASRLIDVVKGSATTRTTTDIGLDWIVAADAA